MKIGPRLILTSALVVPALGSGLGIGCSAAAPLRKEPLGVAVKTQEDQSCPVAEPELRLTIVGLKAKIAVLYRKYQGALLDPQGDPAIREVCLDKELVERGQESWADEPAADHYQSLLESSVYSDACTDSHNEKACLDDAYDQKECDVKRLEFYKELRNRLVNLLDCFKGGPETHIPELNSVEFKEFIANNEWAIVDFYAPWCKPCKAVHEVFKKNKTAIRFPIGRIDVDENEAVQDEYNIHKLPAVKIFHKGQEVGQIVGFKNEEGFLKKLKQILP